MREVNVDWHIIWSFDLTSTSPITSYRTKGFAYSFHYEGETIILSIEGSLNCLTGHLLVPTAKHLIASYPKTLLIDASKIILIDSSGVGVLIRLLWGGVYRQGGHVEIRGLRDQPLSVFRVLRLDGLVTNIEGSDFRSFPLLPQERILADISEKMTYARKIGEPMTLLIGAGCSVSAGIPAANGIVDRIKIDFPSAYARAKTKQYADVMNEIDRATHYRIIHDLVSNANLNWSHLSIAWLIKAGFIGRVYTTNFDDLLIRACGNFGISPAVYDVGTSKVMSETLVREPAIFYLHGRHDGMSQIHTHVDNLKIARRLRRVIQESNFRCPWLIVGYGGDNDLVFDRLSSFKQFTAGLYWTTYRAENPPPRLLQSLLTDRKQGFYCRITSSDRFFDMLLNDLGERPLLGETISDTTKLGDIPASFESAVMKKYSDSNVEDWAYEKPDDRIEADLYLHLARLYAKKNRVTECLESLLKVASIKPDVIKAIKNDPLFREVLAAKKAAELKGA